MCFSQAFIHAHGAVVGMISLRNPHHSIDPRAVGLYSFLFWYSSTNCKLYWPISVSYTHLTLPTKA